MRTVGLRPNDEDMSDDPDCIRPSIHVAVPDAAWSTALADAEELVSRSAARALHFGLHGGEPGARTCRPLEVSLILTDDSEMRRLNRLHRGQDKSTNVLSFPAADWPGGPGQMGAEFYRDSASMPLLLGDVVLARETTIGEAAKQEKAIASHLAHLVVHGVLHLLGYDHLDDVSAAEMEELERTVLSDLGIDDPYDIAPRRARQRS